MMKKTNFKKLYSAFTLKIVALIALMTGMVIVQLNSGEYRHYAEMGWNVPENIRTMMKLGYNIYYFGIPIAAFLLVEGALKTGSIFRYIVRILAAAIITELVFDYAKFGADAIFDFSKGILKNKALSNTPNLFFTLFTGLICVTIMEYGIARHLQQGTVLYNLLNLLVVIVGTVGSYFLGLEHGGSVVLMILVMYFFHDSPFLSLIGIAILQIVMLGRASGFFMYTPVAGTLFTWFYNGKKGPSGKLTRVVSYGAYPVAYLIVVYYLKKNGVL